MFNNEAKFTKKKYVLLTTVAIIGMASSVFAGSKSADSKKAESTTAVQAQIDPATKITVKSSETKETINITFPYHRPGVDKEKLDVNFVINYEKGQKALFRLVPDDCLDVLEINGKEVELTGEALAQRCNWTQGFTIDLQPHLKKGANKVHVLVRNIGGWVGLDAAPAVDVTAAPAATAPAEKK